VNAREIYAKTEEGARELKERSRSLAIGIRTLLIMIDGKRTVADLLDRARALHVDQTAFTELERLGLIVRRFDAPSAAPERAETAPRSAGEVKRFLAVRERMSNAISEHLGFRGYLMMMRLQRAQNLRDLHDLLEDVGRAITKRAGSQVATPLVSELEQLITGED
jgi:hypothetical protein